MNKHELTLLFTRDT